MNSHATQDYHLICKTRMNKFLAQFKHPSEATNTKLDKEAQERMEDNHKAIKSLLLLQVIMVCEKQVLALHGHQDDQIEFVEQKGRKPR